MCFGDKTVDTKNSTSTANPAVSSAATSNLNFAQGLQDKGFQGYTGQQVAGFSPQQQSSFDMTNATANNGTAPAATGLINGYASAPAQNVQADTIANNMSPYMNQYLMNALAPQMRQMDMAHGTQDANLNAQATGSGAFGDARTGIEMANQHFNQNVEREGVIGSAYNNAFNTAIGAGAQDVSNKLSAANANAGYNEASLNRALGGATALEGLQNQQLGVAGAQNTAGQQQTAQQQAGLTAQYNQWLMAQQYPFQTAQLMNQTVASGANAMPASKVETESKPDNSGLAFAGALGSAFLMSDIRVKEDIDEVGMLKDGTPVYSYRYIAPIDPSRTKRIGVMAQDVERRRPDAVITLPGGIKAVDYGRATELSRAFGA